MTKAKMAEQQEAIDDLRQLLKPGDTLHTILRHRSASGMSRSIDVYYLHAENGTVSKSWLSYRIAKACGLSFDEQRESIRMGGCNEDMGFSITYHVGRTLWPEGFECAGGKCRSNDHLNGDRNREPHPHRDGGYALRHEWL